MGKEDAAAAAAAAGASSTQPPTDIVPKDLKTDDDTPDDDLLSKLFLHISQFTSQQASRDLSGNPCPTIIAVVQNVGYKHTKLVFNENKF